RGLTLKSPMIATVTGEGGSGGAIAIAAANRVLILEHSIYSVISPEGAASILWKDGGRAKDAADRMKITAPDLLKMGIVDRIVEEPAGGAHADKEAMIATLGDVLEQELKALSFLTPDQLVEERAKRFYDIGRVGLS
ncbi:MAG: acetyl-CoA carboxylase carboxyltransferase subunit alpha, partial [Asticcacaulis sp.]